MPVGAGQTKVYGIWFTQRRQGITSEFLVCSAMTERRYIVPSGAVVGSEAQQQVDMGRISGALFFWGSLRDAY